MTYIAVIGPGDQASAQDRDDAREIGRLLGHSGVIVVTGGLGGVMQAAAQGCVGAGGQVVGLLPGSDRASGHPHLSVAIPTGLGELRNQLVVRTADGIIAVGGSWGTLSEIAMARRSDVPVVCLRGWRIRDTAGHEVHLHTADSPREAVDVIMKSVRQRRG